ncbi:golgin subfamily A member 6-like protein 7 [Branchiostoma lanceolatum]|uniref:golgin subfamily A member 6-like protein 7 n=1 Tax=Branchiostoma lanceolatum TaxID=7740 RepID=UPI0034511321
MPFRRLLRERAGSRGERPAVENTETYRREIETLRSTNATLARQMLNRDAQFEDDMEELRKKMRRQDARMLMKDNQILKMKRAVDEQNLEIQEYKEQVADLEEQLKTSKAQFETSKAKFAARAEKWRRKINKTAEEVFTDFQLKCQKQVKEHLQYVHEEIADLRLDLQDSRDEETRLLQELAELQDDMGDLQQMFRADRWEDVVGSALRMKDRCAEMEEQSQENKDLRQELESLRQELQTLRSQRSPGKTRSQVLGQLIKVLPATYGA